MEVIPLSSLGRMLFPLAGVQPFNPGDSLMNLSSRLSFVRRRARGLQCCRLPLAIAGLIMAATWLHSDVRGATLYSEDFDDGNAATRWTTATSGAVTSADFAYDYTTTLDFAGNPIGVPQTGQTTHTGLKLAANTERARHRRGRGHQCVRERSGSDDFGRHDVRYVCPLHRHRFWEHDLRHVRVLSFDSDGHVQFIGAGRDERLLVYRLIGQRHIVRRCERSRRELRTIPLRDTWTAAKTRERLGRRRIRHCFPTKMARAAFRWRATFSIGG